MSDPAPYTHGHHESVLRSHRWRTAANSAAYLLPHLTPGTSLLDVGCGPGTITADFARIVAPGRVVGLETSAAIVEIARQDVGDAPVEFAIGDVMALPYEDGTFDVVHAHQVLQHLVDPVGALREMARVCRPGGIVAAREGDFPAMAWFPEDPGLDEWLALYLEVARANHTEPAAGRRVLAWAHEAGMTDVTPSAGVWCYATPDERAWWGTLWADRMVASEVARRAVELGLATGADLERVSAAWRRWAASPDGWFVVVNGGILAPAERPGDRMTRAEAESFAARWCAAWNRRDVDAVLAHFATDAEFASPLVATIIGEPGPLHGRDAIRAYWRAGLALLPELHFTVEEVHLGTDTVAIRYRNERGRRMTEVLRFDRDGLITEGSALYGPEG